MYIYIISWLACGESSDKDRLISSPEKQMEDVVENNEDNQNNDNTSNNENNENIEPPDEDTSSSQDTGESSSFAIYNFTLPDVNPFSSSYGSDITPSDYLGQVTGWYFIKAT